MRSHGRGWCLATLLVAAAGLPVGAFGGEPTADQTEWDRAHDRAKALVSQMTLPEKATQMFNHMVPVERLGLGEYGWWNEALHGVVSIRSTTTVFPEPIGIAASFDTDGLRHMAEVIAEEAVASGGATIFEGLSFYSPNLNIFRDPRWGRGQETYGEDPYLTSKMGVSFIDGLQGPDPTVLRIAATAKHYAVHSGPESSRHGFNAVVSPHDLEDTYLPAFRAAVVTAMSHP